jgi:hypothetical protein
MDRFLRGCVSLVVAAVLASAAQAAGYEETEVANGGAISGKVLLGNAKVETRTYEVKKDFVSCGTGTRTFEWVRANGEAFPDELKKIVVDQKKCAFIPRVHAMVQGGEILTINSDAVWHSVHTYELFDDARRTISNVSQPQSVVGFKKQIKLRRGRVVKFECDSHGFMHGWVFVARNPYFAIVDDKGEFTITDIPAGEYVVKSWHGGLGEKEATVKVAADGNTDVTLSY